jgi:CRP-like cAMP-binding protein
MVGAVRNRVLALMPDASRDAVEADLEPCRLRRGDVLAQQGAASAELYFPSSGLISLIERSSDTGGLEVASVDANGMFGSFLVTSRKVV